MYVEAQRGPFHLAAVWERVGGKCARKLRLLKASSRGEQEKTPIWMIDKELNCFFLLLSPPLDTIAESVQQIWSDVWQQLALPLRAGDRRAYTQHKEESGPRLHRMATPHISAPSKPEGGTDTARRGNVFCKSSTQTQSGPTAKHASVQV